LGRKGGKSHRAIQEKKGGKNDSHWFKIEPSEMKKKGKSRKNRTKKVKGKPINVKPKT